MFKTLLQTIQLQACHCKTNWRSYFKLYLAIPISTLVILGLLFYLTLNTNNISFVSVLYIVSLFFVLLLLSKINVHAFRFITLDEKPKHIIHLKYSKQTFLYLSYTFLITLILVIFHIIMLYLLSWLVPFDYTTINPLSTESDTITNSLVNTFNQNGMQVNSSGSNLYVNASSFIAFFISTPIIFSLFIFNSIAIASDINIPFYRHIMHLKKFFCVNYLLIILCEILSAILIMATQYTTNFVLIAGILIFQIYLRIFLMLCLVQNFKLWHQTHKLEK